MSLFEHNEICFVIPYFGKLPQIFPYWLESCRRNEKISWLLVGDSIPVDQMPSNVRTVGIEFATLKRLFDQKLGFKTNLECPYKLCDFKPAFPFLFSDITRDFEFCGWCDMDVIWGDLRKFFPTNMKEYDKIFEFGHCCLLKNSKRMNEMFRERVPGCLYYQDVFLDATTHGFDENCFLSGKGGGFMQMCRTLNCHIYSPEPKVFADVQPGRCLFSLWSNEAKQWKDVFFIVGSPPKTTSVIYKFKKKLQRKEMAYIHLQKRKFVLKTTSLTNYVILPPGELHDLLDAKKIEKELPCRFVALLYELAHVFFYKRVALKIRQFMKKVKI